MMFSSKAEERVDKKDMVSNVFMCRKLYFVCFYSVLFLLLTMILFIYSRFQQDLFATFDLPEMRDGVGHYCVVALNVKERRFEFLAHPINLAALMQSGFLGGWLKISSVHGKKEAQVLMSR